MILPMILFAFHCISRSQLVGVGVKSGPEFILTSPASISATVPASAAQPQIVDLTSRESLDVLAVNSVVNFH